MSKIFLIDTENVNFNAVIDSRSLSEDDMIILFLTIATNKHYDKVKLDALNTFNIAFGYNFDVVERCKPVVNNPS